jgi:hypothetical protein
MKILMLALSAGFVAGTASCANDATARPLTKAHARNHAASLAVTVHPERNPTGGWGGSDYYTKGWGGWGWGCGYCQGLLAGAIINGTLSAPYYDFEFGYPPNRPPYGYPYLAFPYFRGYPYYNIPYGYFRPPPPRR